jgi:hypothetical protein
MFVERTRSTSHSAPRVVSPVAAWQTGLYSIKGWSEHCPRRWPHECSRLRRPLTRGGAPAVLGRAAGPSTVRIVALSNSDRRVSGGRPSQPVVGRAGIARHDALRGRHPCCPLASAASLVISSIEAAAVPPQHERHHVPRAGLLVPLPVHSASRSDVRAAHGLIADFRRSCSRQSTAARQGRYSVGWPPCDRGFSPGGRSG